MLEQGPRSRVLSAGHWQSGGHWALQEDAALLFSVPPP